MSTQWKKDDHTIPVDSSIEESPDRNICIRAPDKHWAIATVHASYGCVDHPENDINLYDVVSYGERLMLEDLFKKGGIYASVKKSPLTGNLHVVAVSINGDWPLKDKLLLFRATSATEWKEVMSDEKIYIS